MITYYTGLVEKYGKDFNGEKRLYATWKYGLVILDDNDERYDYEWEWSRFYYVSKKNPDYEKGYPLGAISKYIKNDEYYKYENKSSNETRGEVEFVISKLGKK